MNIMPEQSIEIKTPDGTADGFLYTSESAARAPGVLFLTDIGGIRPAQKHMAQRLAGAGYTVLLPNLFYRTGRPPLFELPVKFGEEKTTKRIQELLAALPPQLFDHDAPAYVDFLSSQQSVSPGPAGVVGFCFAGGLAMRTAAAKPDKIAAAASFHGGRLYTDNAASPHLVLPRIKAELYFGHATEDKSMPQEAIDKLNEALAAWGGKYESEVYPAHHGWTVPDNPSYNKPEAERAFEKLTGLFQRTLQQAAAKSA